MHWYVKVRTHNKIIIQYHTHVQQAPKRQTPPDGFIAATPSFNSSCVIPSLAHSLAISTHASRAFQWTKAVYAASRVREAWERSRGNEWCWLRETSIPLEWVRLSLRCLWKCWVYTRSISEWRNWQKHSQGTTQFLCTIVPHRCLRQHGLEGLCTYVNITRSYPQGW